VIRPLPPEVDAVLDHGSLCYLAVGTRLGPHVTPVVYAMLASRIWVTTARRTVKAGVWRVRPRASGLVRAGDHAVSFTGIVRLHDALDPTTWLPSALSLPTIALAAAEFTRRNARFFAGYAVDARRVPLSWTPPGRVFAEIAVEAAALLEDWGEAPKVWGRMGETVHSHGSFRPGRAARSPLDLVPDDVSDQVDRGGQAVLAVDGADGPVVLPVLFVEDRGILYAAVEARSLELAEAGPDAAVGLTVDRASRWRASAMTGVLVRGTGSIHVLSRLRSGRAAAERLVERAGALPEGMALVRVRPRRLVWWRGWASGTVVLDPHGRVSAGGGGEPIWGT
jgi:nitroimidazol reductase NimA-like FMN-containing flavoprotein (pyridoxamine 5'-phosphate oxidase superfamily)